jgi:hypothetical protein
MDWADDVAYSVHDVEDGIHGGYLPLHPLLDDPDERAALCADVAATYSDESAEALGDALLGLLADGVVAATAGYDGSYSAQVALKRMTSDHPPSRCRPAAPLRRRPGGAAYGPGPGGAAEGDGAAVRHAGPRRRGLV